MSRYTLILLPFVLGLSGPGFGAEVGKSNQIDSLTSFQLGDYSLKFDGENPRKPSDLYDPPGLKSFRKDAFNPFVGLKLSSPLKDNFFEPGREMGTGSTGGIETQ
ncbi:MAG: hypothetical protein WCC81_24035 [Pseudolabrys sp.]|jgi:hypothetical protein